MNNSGNISKDMFCTFWFFDGEIYVNLEYGKSIWDNSTMETYTVKTFQKMCLVRFEFLIERYM